MTPTIISITGKQGSGKTTAAKTIAASLQEKGYTVDLLKFATPLYHAQDILKKFWAPMWGIKMDEKEGKLLQVIGTEWGRETKGENIWVDALRRHILGSKAQYILIDDMRFPNELTMLEQLDAIIVRLTCAPAVRQQRCDAWREGVHISEESLNDVEWDNEINTEHLTESGVVSAIFGLIQRKKAA
jgi:RecA/RadA recombinase